MSGSVTVELVGKPDFEVKCVTVTKKKKKKKTVAVVRMRDRITAWQKGLLKDVPPCAVVVGNPARVIKTLDAERFHSESDL